MRLATVVNGVLRKATKDIELNSMTEATNLVIFVCPILFEACPIIFRTIVMNMMKVFLLCFSCSSGFIVPKGWRIYLYTREINYDLNLYPEPLKFNPWRWLVRYEI